ncbi:MAG TPA: penicillin acylase family protein, partial [Ilumatobacteraceae bacterium]|nr:penicillin acylase family protein [Ilumatobacteraceae bacterium]
PIATATPPAAASDDADGAADDTAITSSADAATDDAVVLPEMRTDLASNGWAIGSELSDTGGGLLLANPHFPWEGERRLWESQLTLTTGELNVYGATLSGVPGVLIGFNDAVAWTHTVSAGYRMTLYELTLTPDDPTSYVYGDDAEAMTPTDITIEVLGDDGSTDEVTRTMWSSHYGPMLNLPFGWSTEKAYTYRDANLDNADILGQFFGMNQATSMDEFIEAHREFNGIPWVNTMATSADGQAWYADTASAPNLSDDTIAEWQAAVDSGALAAVILDNGAILLDGSNPANEWVDDPAATRPGILPFDEQPQLLRDDFIFNANDSHWLANPDELLTGYSPMTGAEEIPQSARTRMNVALLTDPELRGTDGKFSLAEIQAAIFSNRSMHADLLLKQVLDVCENASTPELDNDRGPVDLTDTCDVLRDWDGTYGIDSVGAVLWREFMNRFDNTDMTDAGALYAVGFDPTDPAGTPNTLNADPEPIVQALAEATFGLVEAGFGVDAVLGDLQFDGRTVDEHIPLPGGTWADGTASIVGCCSGSNSTAETGTRGTWSDIYSFSNIGYPVSFGNSFMMTLQFTDDGPVAEALLNYGQPDDPADP